MTTSSRKIANDVRNVLDFLQISELALYVHGVDERPNRVTFHRSDPRAAFLISRAHPGVDQYRHWIAAGAYSAVLPDASLLQLTYDIADGQVSGHRLAYIPCPFEVDSNLLGSESILDVVDLYRDGDLILRSPIRFDFDPGAARGGHPAAHMTINGVDCRIACVAPIHPLRFVDFVFRHFYPGMWAAQEAFFSPAPYQHFGRAVLADDDRKSPHIMWEVHPDSSAGPGPTGRTVAARRRSSR